MNDTLKSDYFLIDVTSLLDEKLLGCDLYIIANDKFVLYRSADLPFTDKHRQNIISRKLSLYINNSDKNRYIDYLKSNISNIKTDSSMTCVEKSKYYYHSSKMVISQFFNNKDTSSLRENSEILTEAALSILHTSDFEIKNILESLQFEYSTYTHSLNVSLVASIFAQTLGLNDTQLKSITEGALLHDIGKKEIDHNILFKPGKLTNDEWELVKKHPVFGWDLLKEINYNDAAIKNIVLYHHEKIDGSGYPEGLTDIPMEAQIVSICDIFDALTSQRCYKSALGSFPAFKIMLNEMSTALNKELLVKFIQIFKDVGQY